MSRLGSRSRDGQDGTAIIEVTWLTLLLLVPFVYLLLSVFQLQSAAFGVDAASRAAARAYSLAPDQATGQARARQAAGVALRDQGVPGERAAIEVTCDPTPGACLQPGSVITVRIHTQVTLPLIPDVFGDFRPTVRVSGEHRVPYGRFQEGRP